MFTLRDSFSEYKGLSDPPPDISKYDCRHRGRREECLIKDSPAQESIISPSKKEEVLGAALGISEDIRSKAWNCCGKDNFKITLNSSGRFLMNTAISVTVDFNPQRMSQLEVKSKVCGIKSLGSSVKSSSRIPMGEYYSQDTFTFQKEHSRSSCVEKLSSWHHPKDNDLKRTSCSQTSPAKKRVLSPRNGRSPNKRKKSFSPQKNKIYNYFVQADSFKIESKKQCTEVENHSFVRSSVADNMNWRDTRRLCNSNRIVKNSVEKHQSSDTDVIVVSSDEDELPDSISMKEVQERTSWQTHSNTLGSHDEKPRVPIYNGNKLEQKVSNTRNVSVNLSGSPNRKNIDNEVVIVSSDEEDNLWFSSQSVIDLTCDDLCSSDDAGGVIVPESKHFRKDLMGKDGENNEDDDDDDDDDCISVISYQPGLLSQRDSCIKKGLNNISLEGKIDTENLSTCADEFLRKGAGLEENIKSDERLVGSHVPPYISHLETNSHLEDLHSKCAIEHPLEHTGNVSDRSFEVPDGNTTDSTSSSPPHLCEDGNDLVSLDKACSKNEDYERRECLEDEEQRSVLKDNENSFVGNSSPSCKVKDKSVFNFDEIVGQCSEGKINEKKEIDVTTSEEVINKIFPRVISPSAKRVCQVQAEVLLSKMYQPWIDLDTDEVPQCCEIGPAKCNSVHGKKELCPEESDFFDEILLWRMDCGTSAIDLVQSRLDVFVYPTSSVLQNLLVGCMDLWVEGVSDAIKWLRHLLRLHPPCAFGMLDYYRKVLFNPVMDMKAPDGIFWLCIGKIEEVVNAIEKQNAENNAPNEASSDQEDSSDIVEKFLHCVDPLLSCEKDVDDIKLPDKLKKLFDTLDYLIRIMEADLNMGLLKNYSNLKRYMCKTGRPLIAVALWGIHGKNVGNVNTKCRHLMKMYMQIFESYRDTDYLRSFRRLISLMAGVTYASERNSEPPKYPNVESNCRDLANAFASIMMASALNMMEVRLVLESLTPDWFRICVCSNLLEKLYGRNMELSLRPTVVLLKSLNELNQDYPSGEEISETLLAEQDTNKAPSKDSEELSPNYVKQATKKDKRGETRLHIACRRNNIQEVERLLNVPDININEKDHMGWTPLHEAAFHGNVECVKCLLNFRTPAGGPAVDLQVRNEGGVTPLMDAVSKNHLEVASVLLQYGGQKLLSDENGEGCSVWDLARTEEMKCVLLNAQDRGQEFDLITIPRTLYVKLAVLTPLAIKYYIKFSEVLRIAYYLKNNTELTKDWASLVKFQPIAFKKDYFEFKELQSFLKEKMNNNINNKLLFSLDCFT